VYHDEFQTGYDNPNLPLGDWVLARRAVKSSGPGIFVLEAPGLGGRSGIIIAYEHGRVELDDSISKLQYLGAVVFDDYLLQFPVFLRSSLGHSFESLGPAA
jgi:hypothetical protein